MCVVCNSIQWIYRHNPNLHLLHMSPYISLHLFVCLLASLSYIYLLYVLCLLAFYACFLVWCLRVCFAYGGWSMCLTSKKQANGAQISIFQGFNPSRGPLFPTPFLQNHVQSLSYIRFLFLYLTLGHTFWWICLHSCFICAM